VYTKVIKMISWNALVQRPSGLIKVERSASTFIRCYLGKGRECFVEASIDSQPKLISDKIMDNDPFKYISKKW
jgi:hypothetical protein